MIFDTNVLIYAHRGFAGANEIILAADERAISAVTYMEYVAHCRDKLELTAFERVLDALRFTIHEIDGEISRQAREYTRRFALSHSMEMGDALVAATALKRADTLCTSNAKHFRHISGIELALYRPRKQ